VEDNPAYDIREIRPDEIAAACGLLNDGPTADTLERRLSVGAVDPEGGALRGVALHETLTPRGCAVHLHCDDTGLGRILLDRALSKAAAAGHRASRVVLHPEPTAQEVWNDSGWPANRSAETDAEALDTGVDDATETETADADADAAAA